MAKETSPWRVIQLTPLTGELDIRSRPSDVVPGGFRYKLNFETTPEGKIQRRGGFAKAFSGVGFSNHDHHRQGALREPITFSYEFTSGDGARTLYDGTQSRISKLAADTGIWTDIVTGKGATNAKWSAADLQDSILFTNNVDEPLLHDTLTNTAAPIPELQALTVRKAKVVAEFNGVLMVMNVVEGVGGAAKRFSSRIYWSNLNAPTAWNQLPADTVAGVQDLPYGDDILAAMPLLGGLYIFTRRAIWRCNTGGSTPQDIFTFTKVYNEPENQAGCLAFPYTLVSTGEAFFYMGRDGIYSWDPYIPAPVRQEWIHKASGYIYKKQDTAMSGKDCNLPISKYLPAKKELWYSWPLGDSPINTNSMALALDWKTADLIDHGFTAFRNFRLTPADQFCNEKQLFLGVSGRDWAWKDIGVAFYREIAILAGAITADLPAVGIYTKQGYYSQLIGMIPTGLLDREKRIRNLLIDDDPTFELTPPYWKLRIGNSYSTCDPTDLDDVCAPEWRETIPPYSLACPDNQTISAMKAKGQKPAIGREFPCYEQNRVLYFDLRIENLDGSPAIGGDVALNRIDMDIMVCPKP